MKVTLTLKSINISSWLDENMGMCCVNSSSMYNRMSWMTKILFSSFTTYSWLLGWVYCKKHNTLIIRLISCVNTCVFPNWVRDSWRCSTQTSWLHSLGQKMPICETLKLYAIMLMATFTINIERTRLKERVVKMYHKPRKED